MAGPLQGFKVIEMAGLGPAPFAGMLMADLGAEVICIDRIAPPEHDRHSIHSKVLRRNKQSLALNLKQPLAIDAVLRLIESADVLIEGFRPGVMEKQLGTILITSPYQAPCMRLVPLINRCHR